ncbi:MAG TPA: DUF2332 domain-containing protein [Propionibacteriaceae bacterium]|nr:DUF2332 domain-containing protein [Micropruina sp.]HBX79742.1 DUF2332 domain-containing protein [Propionibacteriaceae bacterium]HBY24611.1 DUF2332 domain-containing protein [Propionibacteriaceae bacterium]
MRTAGFFASAPTAEQYAWFAHEAAATSPAWERVCRFVSVTPALTSLLDGLPGAKRQPNLYLAALKFLGGPLEPGDALVEWTRARWSDVETVILTHATQTNEVGRCAVLAPLLSRLPQPLGLIEVGSSAGLCLFPDLYSYAWEHEDGTTTRAGAGDIELRCRTTGVARAPYAVPEIAWRAGLDLNPLDPSDPDVAWWLRALVWPGETEREERLVRALQLVAEQPMLRVQGDATTGLADVVAAAPRGLALVVIHSAVLAYLDRPQRTTYLGQLDALGVHWVAQEGRGVLDGVAAQLPTGTDPRPHFVASSDGVPLAQVSPHGQWLDWLPR